MKPKILYKSLPLDRAPNGHKFRLNKWYKEEDIEICKRGFHASENIIDAMGYINAGWLAIVEVKGESQKRKDKQCWSEMRVVKWYKWTKKDGVALAVYAAELVLKNFEKKYPNDKTPREAIEAAKAVLVKDTKQARSAARSAAAAAWFAARSAEYAALSAEYADQSALSAAWSAALSAEYAARSAESAESAALSAALSTEYAKKKTLTECHNFVLQRANFKL